MSAEAITAPDGRPFETFLAALSARFLLTPAEQVNGQIDHGLAEVATFLGIDRCSLAEFSADGRDLIVTHSFTVPGVPPVPRVNLAVVWPWYTGQIRGGTLLRFTRLPEEAPDDAAAEKEHTRRHGPRSHVAIPFRIGGAVIGGIGFATFGREYEWPDELVVRLRLIGDVFTNALARKAALHEREARRISCAPPSTADATGWVYVLGTDGEAFRTAGRQVRVFGTGAELLAAALDGPGCVVIDLDQCGPAGLDVQAALAARELAPPVVFLTGRADVPLSVRAMKAGAIDVLTRPFVELALQEAAARGVERHAAAIRHDQEMSDLRRRHESLSSRERQVMALVVTGLANKVVATRLGVCEKTVKAHRGAVMRKMQADSLAGLVRMAERLRSGRSSSAASC